MEQSRAQQSRGRDSAVIDGCLGGGVLKVARGGEFLRRMGSYR